MELPPAGHIRWHARRKMAVVRALLAGTLSPAQARGRYLLSDEELESWLAAYGAHGVGGLHVKSLRYRRHPARDTHRPVL